MKKIVHVAGKRKRAIARATLKIGKGVTKINSQLLDVYEPRIARLKIMEPLILAGEFQKKFDIDVNVCGGGWHSQSEAVRLAIARGLVQITENKELKQRFLDYDRNLLIADVRRKETRKPNDSKARKARQKSYR